MEALRRSNPMLTEECKKEALHRAIPHHTTVAGTTPQQSLEAVSKHIRERQQIVSTEGVSARNFFRHLVECKGFCGPHAVELLSCHVLAVSSSNHVVKHSFNRRGVSADRVSTLWLGEEPPQLQDWIADLYGFGDLERGIGSDPFNQSVVVVIY